MNSEHTPWWVIMLIILLVLPAGQTPVLLANAPAGVPIVRTLVWIYPFYVFVAGYLAYACWQRQRMMTWILLALLVLTHLAMWMLVTAKI
ncbi:MAG: hypothetical protein K2I18_03845 [Paramuribaculum sp.]|nr:hypothetical protein [Paramuribaculum sp.]